MAANDYQFVTDWRVEGDIQEVYDIIADDRQLARWWPSVYLDVRELEPGNETGIGKAIDLHTKGWLPYTLRWQARTVESAAPHHLAIEAQGDFVGRGVWTLEQDGPWVNLTFDWQIRADKPILRHLSFLLKPIFAANHRWAMGQGDQSLRLELARRRAKSEAERAAIPDPPVPSTAPVLWLLLSAVALLCLVLWRKTIASKAE
ncbi:MAG: SRPBCC family protein [Abitibacteriaceae bacterium]|nr:SRPBCC family protein [Abditibacteriaceae bacterium]